MYIVYYLSIIINHVPILFIVLKYYYKYYSHQYKVYSIKIVSQKHNVVRMIVNEMYFNCAVDK